MNSSGAEPYMCGSSMGMVFCPPDYSSNSGTGFSLLFQSWVIHDTSSYALSCCGVLALGMARQLVSGLRTVLSRSQHHGREGAPQGSSGSAAGGVQEPMLETSSPSSRAPRSPLLLLAADTGLFAAGLFLAYLNMLVAMAYDFGLLSSLVLGEALAYFLVHAALLAYASKLGSSSRRASAGEGDCCS